MEHDPSMFYSSFSNICSIIDNDNNYYFPTQSYSVEIVTI